MMHDFWLALGMIFLAELGDKTQLVALTLATHYNARLVLTGIFLATLAIHVVSAGLGLFVGGLLPVDWIRFLAGLAFVGFGFWTIRGDCLDDEEGGVCRNVSPFWLVFTTFFMAELGDKTMLGTVTLASTGAFIPVWLGSTIGMVASDGLAIMVGRILGKQLPERLVKIGAAVIFFGFGCFSLVRGGLKLPLWVWPVGLVLLALLACFFFRPFRWSKTRAGAAKNAAEKEVA